MLNSNLRIPVITGTGSKSVVVSSIFVLDLFNSGAEAIFSRFTMTSMTGSWYSPLTPFEVIFIGLVILQIFVLRYLQILPISFTDFIQTGVLLGKKRKRRSPFGHFEPLSATRNQVEIALGEDLLRALRKLDHEDCLLQTICLMESLRYVKQGNDEINKSSSLFGFGFEQLPKGIKWVLNSLRSSGHKRRAYESVYNNNNITILDRPIIAIFEEAVEYGRPINKKLSLQKTLAEVKHMNSSTSSFSAVCEEDDNDDLMSHYEEEYELNNKNNNNNSIGNKTTDEDLSLKTAEILCHKRFALCSLSVNDTLSYIQSIMTLFKEL